MVRKLGRIEQLFGENGAFAAENGCSKPCGDGWGSKRTEYLEERVRRTTAPAMSKGVFPLGAGDIRCRREADGQMTSNAGFHGNHEIRNKQRNGSIELEGKHSRLRA
ncbi:hypothetical protein ERJ75_000509400 [Trypanosoma vivax]|nr:hypothetical protein TRVL_09835 [Trypanosoma vivax]KAH8609620.1 hypothetical protein ERJ75_001182800 [Trypanosoma vivax]KAH8616148.1 hypothetical protein ERJ75_000509400 [Trypanosoma vivax]